MQGNDLDTPTDARTVKLALGRYTSTDFSLNREV